MEFSLDEIKDSSILIDFENKSISIESKNSVDSSSSYEISCSVGDIGRLLDGYLNWEDFMLSFRHRLKRTPDVYQVAINGFLTMEKEDVPNFVDNLMRLQNQRERITVEVGGVMYSIDKFCPHQGSDLTTHQIEDDRFLIFSLTFYKVLERGKLIGTNGPSGMQLTSCNTYFCSHTKLSSVSKLR